MTDGRRKRLALALVLFGAALRTWQFAERGSLWLDEAAVARNILARDWGQLLQPLDYAQIAPKGFLLVSKAAVMALGPTEGALRLYAFVLSLLALPIFYRLARRLLPAPAALYALGLFAVLGRPIYYASEAKQYGGDLFFSVLLMLLAVPVVRGKPGARHALRLGVAAAVAVWFSQPALFVIAGIALGIAIAFARGKLRANGSLLAMLGIAGASVVPALYVTLHALLPPDSAYMSSFWQGGFLPLPSAQGAHLIDMIVWPFAGLYGLFYDLLGMPVAMIGLALASLGAVVIWRRDRGDLLLLMGPVGALLVAGALHLYPFGTTLDGFNKLSAGNARVLLFLLPMLVLLVVAGIEALLRDPRRLQQRVGGVLAVVTLGTPLYYDLTEVPYSPHDLRPTVAAVSRYVRPGDRLYVYYGARQAFELYRTRFPFPDSAVVRGECHRPAWREYLRDLDAFRGSGRLWVLMVRPALVNGVREGDAIDSYLGQISPRLARWGRKDAYVSLYDMRIVRPLGHADSESHLPPRKLPSDSIPLGYSCAGIFPPAGADTSLTARRNPGLAP